MMFYIHSFPRISNMLGSWSASVWSTCLFRLFRRCTECSRKNWGERYRMCVECIRLNLVSRLTVFFRVNLISFPISCLSPDATTSLPRKSLRWLTLPRDIAPNQKQAYQKSQDRSHLNPSRSHPRMEYILSIPKTLQFENLLFIPSISNITMLQKNQEKRMLLD